MKSKKASNLWADTDEEDNAENDTGENKNPEEVQQGGVKRNCDIGGKQLNGRVILLNTRTQFI